MSIYLNGVTQDVDPRDATLAVGEAKTGSTFYAVTDGDGGVLPFGIGIGSIKV